MSASTAYKQIRIATTDLAIIAGMDHYNRLSSVICKLWKQLDRESFDRLTTQMRKNGHMIATDSFYSKIAHYDHKTRKQGKILQQVKKLNQQRSNHSSALVGGQDDIHKAIDDKLQYHLRPSDREHLKSLVNSATNTMYGCRTENRGTEIFQRETGKIIKSAQGLNKWVIYRDDARRQEWVVTGKLDGLTEDGEILEIKNRQKGLFNVMRDYEMCQVQCYLNNVPAEHGYLLEVYKANAESDAEFNIHKIDRDIEYYTDNIQAHIPRLVEFMNRLVFSTYFSDSFKLAALEGDRQGKVKYMFNHGPEFNHVPPATAPGIVTHIPT